jgi:hypothetical protein
MVINIIRIHYIAVDNVKSTEAKKARSLARNFDILIIIAGIAILPLAGPFGSYYVSLYSSTASGADISIYFAGFGLVILGLVLRIYRYINGKI